MNLSPDLQGTQRRLTLREYRRWADKQNAEYAREKEQGSPLPAFVAWALVCAGIALGLWWRG